MKYQLTGMKGLVCRNEILISGISKFTRKTFCKIYMFFCKPSL